MRRLFYAAVFISAFNALTAYCAQGEGMRVIIATTGKASYSVQKLESPARIVLNFSSKNVFSNASGNTIINKGPLLKIETEYYPRREGGGLKPLKSLVFYLSEDTPYRINQELDSILIDFLTTRKFSSKIEVGQIEGKGSDYIAKRDAAMDEALKGMARDVKLNAPSQLVFSEIANDNILADAPKIGWQDITYLAILGLCVFLLIGARRDWAALKETIVKKKGTAFLGAERRKWWRHDLAPLGADSISLELTLPVPRDKGVKVAARNIGYGGASFDIPLTRRLPHDVPIIVDIILQDKTTVRTEGVLIWQRGTKNILRRSYGVVFTKHLHSNWDKINRFIEEKYRAL